MKRLSILIIAVTSLVAFGGQRPYEFEWANRTADENSVLDPLVGATDWEVSASNNAVAVLSTGTDRVLFGDGVLRVAYRATGKEPSFKISPKTPLVVPEGSDTLSVWIYGNSIRTEAPKVTITADFIDAEGKPLSFVAYRMRHMGWFMMQVKIPKNKLERLAKSAKFTGFTVTDGTNPNDCIFELTSLAIFKEELKPLSFKPQPKRPHQIFPNAPKGMNTGDGYLPFPNRENTVIADEQVRGVVWAETAEDGACTLVRKGSDGKLEIRLPRNLREWDDMVMRWNGSEWHPFAIGGGCFFAGYKIDKKSRPRRRAVSESESKWRAEGSTFVRDCELVSDRGLKAQISARARLIGKALSLEISAKGGEIAEIRFGSIAFEPEMEPVQLPYFALENGIARASVVKMMAGDEPMFHFAFDDWTQSNASKLDAGSGNDSNGNLMSNGGAVYDVRTDGVRNDCYERFVYAFSPIFEDVMPVVPNPPSPYRSLTADYQWCHVYLGKSRDKEYPAWRDRHRRGLKKVMIHDWETCMRDEHESFTFRKTAAPGKGGDKGMYDFTRFLCDELGYLYGPYNNYTDFAPVNGYWNEGRAARDSDGNFIGAWYRCYSPRPAWCPEACDEIVSELQRKYRFNTGYCDVQTCITPWSRTDYDARVPGAGTFAATYYAYGLTLLKQRENWTGPVYSEGGNHYLYCGLNDGNFAQDQRYHPSVSPWLVDFDLRRLHPLANNFGMGYFQMFYGSHNIPKDRYAKLDRFLAATVAFGHIGYFCIGNPEEEEHGYFMIQAIAGKYARCDVDQIRYFDVEGRTLDTSAAVMSGAFQRSQVTSRYVDGTVTVVNGCPNANLVLPMKGRKLVLPPNGWYALSGDRTVSVVSGKLDGHRLDLSVSPDYIYINAHSKFVQTPFGATDGALIRLMEKGGTEEVFIWRGQAGASLPYAAQSVVKVDESGKENGAAEYEIVDGQTVLRPQDGKPVTVPPPPETPVAITRIELPRSRWVKMCYRGEEEQEAGQGESGARFGGKGYPSSGGIVKNGFSTHPPYIGGVGYVNSTWRIRLPSDYAVDFKGFVGLEDGHGKSDGVTFKVTVTDMKGVSTDVISVHHTEVKWAPIEANLSQWRGQMVRLTLTSDCGPADNTSCDASCWGDVRLEPRAPVK